MSQNDELKKAWQKQLNDNRNGVSDFWRANAAYWQTVSDIMSARAATFTSWWQSLPQHMQGFAQAKSWPEFAEAFTRWQQKNWLSTWHLGVDTQQQRNYLWEEWQKLAQRNGMVNPFAPAPEKEKSVAPSSFYAANPHLQPQAPVAKPAPAKAATQPAPQPAPAPKAAQPVKAEPIITAAATAPVTADLNGEAVQPHPEPARNAAQAATLAAATSARRSVVASHRSRAARRTTH
ncbi:MAG TPA: hypothetical protein VHP58_05495 [Alphaproteobacteria bacterium]|nr:hypothetical protein [Alphaproteobacteria bacterium]